MNRLGLALLILTCSGSLSASWYWPFGDDEEEVKVRRLSELMEPATLLIDEAADLASDGKTTEAVEKYRVALKELDRIEKENPERAATAEFATLRNKRAYVTAAVDSMLMTQAKANAKTVAVSDTTELERKLAAERAGVKPEADNGATSAPEPSAPEPAVAEQVAEKPAADKPVRRRKPRSSDRREQVLADIADKDFAAAEQTIRDWLQEVPNNVVALNLKAALEAERGDFKAAEAALDQAISSNPRSHFAYYNMAQLLLDVNPDGRDVARRYYETGRMVGGPVDEQLEEKFR